jgi:hypothetical protein
MIGRRMTGLCPHLVGLVLEPAVRLGQSPAWLSLVWPWPQVAASRLKQLLVQQPCHLSL